MKLSYTQTLDEKAQGARTLQKTLVRKSASTAGAKKWKRVGLIYGVVVFAVAFGSTIVQRSDAQLATATPPPSTPGWVYLVQALPFLLIITLFVFFMLRLQKAQRNQIEATHGQGPFSVDVEATESQFIYSEGVQESRFGWTGVDWLEDHAEGLAFAFKPCGNVWIPNSAFADDAERMAWKTFIEARIDDAKKLTD